MQFLIGEVPLYTLAEAAMDDCCDWALSELCGEGVQDNVREIVPGNLLAAKSNGKPLTASKLN